MNETVLAALDLSIGYGRGREAVRRVFSGINCGIHRGELVSLIGPNGIGKSTLLRTLGGLHPALAGSVVLCGREIHEYPSNQRAEKLGLVLTDRVRAGSMKVRSLVALGRYPHTPWSGALGRKDWEAVEASLGMTALEDLAGRYFSELSDGEKQKVMLARAIAQEPTVLILDEPTAFLDLPGRIEVVGILKKLTRDKDVAVLLSTHDLDLALKTTDRLWILSEGVFASGAPEDLVLNGSLGKAFHGRGLSFHPAEGQFVMHEGHGTVVYVSGKGLEAVWTKRALERDGYSVEEGEQEPCVRVGPGEKGGVHWCLRAGDETFSGTDILSLVSTLQKKIRP